MLNSTELGIFSLKYSVRVRILAAIGVVPANHPRNLPRRCKKEEQANFPGGIKVRCYGKVTDQTPTRNSCAKVRGF